MNIQEKLTIRKIQAILIAISNKKQVFFNIAQYKNLGLVTTTNKWAKNASGNKIICGTNYHLTKKAKSYLNIII